MCTLLRLMRVARGLKQTELARQVQIDVSALSRIETRMGVATKEQATRLAEFFGAEIDQLFDPETGLAKIFRNVERLLAAS